MNKDATILIVEDSVFQREICLLQLRELGFGNLFSAENGLEALEVLKDNTVDVVISDWEMPEMDGIALLKRAKDDPGLREIPFLMLTVHEDKEANKEALDLGAVDYVVKPSNPEVLTEKLGCIL